MKRFPSTLPPLPKPPQGFEWEYLGRGTGSFTRPLSYTAFDGLVLRTGRWTSDSGILGVYKEFHYVKKVAISAENPAKDRWTYSRLRATIRLKGKPFAIVTSDGKNALSDADQAKLLFLLNR